MRAKGEVVNGCKICPRCGVDKPLTEWGINVKRASGLGAYCKICAAAIQAEFRARRTKPRAPRNPAQDRDYARRWRERNPDAVRSYCATRRARRQAATTEKFSVAEIFERDAWMCHLCLESIDPAVAYPDPLSASLDHVIPLAKGGEHSRDNAAAAHLICNMRKKDKVATCAQ